MLAGCIIIPVPPYGEGKLAPASIDSIKPGVTTREDVLLDLGPPSHRLAADRIFAYEWQQTVAHLVVGFPGGAAGSGVKSWQVFAVEFDRNGVVLRAQDMSSEYTGKNLHQWIEESPQGLGKGGSLE
jgi:outer membrane protein assembly factor BamE (lipoprotein component of BamABCDE complex)